MEKPESIEEFYGLECNLKSKLKFIEWDQKKKYEENLLAINIRNIDTDGTLELVSSMDRSLCKMVPQAIIKNGILYIKVRRGI